MEGAAGLIASPFGMFPGSLRSARVGRGGDPEVAVAVRRRAGHLGQFFPVHPRGRRAHTARGGRVRAVTGAALAARRRAFRGLRQVIVPIAVVTLLDMAAPAFLTAWGEQRVSFSVAGNLTATDPLFADDPSGAVPVQAPSVSG